MCAKDLKDTAAMWLEELNISGDTMVAMNHNLEDVPKEQQGSYNLFDLLDLFVDHVREGDELKQNADKALSLSGVSVSLRDEMATRFAQTKMRTWDGELSNKHREAILEDWINRYGEGLTIAQNIVKDAYYLADEMLKHK